MMPSPRRHRTAAAPLCCVYKTRKARHRAAQPLRRHLVAKFSKHVHVLRRPVMK